jgi:hypothetical protein
MALSEVDIELAGGLVKSGMTRLKAGLPNAFSRLKQRLAQGKSASVLVIGDSTGNASPEWPFLFGPGVTALYPAVTSRIRTWSTGTTAYETSWTTLSTGSGSPVLSIHNFSVSGSQTYYGLGALFAKAMMWVDPDVIIINHGHNHNSTALAASRGAFYALIETLLLAHPGVPIAFIRQNPKQDNDTMAAIVALVDEIGAARGITTIDAYSAFIAAGKPTSLYDGDNTHPNAAGQLLFHAAVMGCFNEASLVAPQDGKQSSFAVPVRAEANLLTNGNFATWTTNPGTPDGWTKAGAGTMTPEKETTIVADAGRAYSVKLLGTGGASWIAQSITGDALTAVKGKSLCLAIKRYVSSASSTSTLGKGAIIATSTSLGSVSAEIASYVTNQTGWVWWALSGFDVPEDTTALEVRLYHDNAATPSTSPAYFDQACLTFGPLPKAAR